MLAGAVHRHTTRPEAGDAGGEGGVAVQRPVRGTEEVRLVCSGRRQNLPHDAHVLVGAGVTRGCKDEPLAVEVGSSPQYRDGLEGLEGGTSVDIGGAVPELTQHAAVGVRHDSRPEVPRLDQSGTLEESQLDDPVAIERSPKR